MRYATDLPSVLAIGGAVLLDLDALVPNAWREHTWIHVGSEAAA